jgi:hypothetical protein
MLTYTLSDKFAHIINLFRDGARSNHIFEDHWISFQMFDEKGHTVCYIIAHDYGTGEKIFLPLSMDEMSTLRKEIKRVEGIRDTESTDFKKAVARYIKAISATM